tara:strand:- start:1093 stop:1452 length:360 start_codon:yes stop_codon:yes gene_type:complete
MKLAVIATAATLLVATQASAIDLGNGLTAGGEVDFNYTTGTELWALEATPEVGINFLGADFVVGSTFDLMDLNGNDPFKGLDLSVDYPVGTTGLTAYGKISTDTDFAFGDLTVGTSFAF